MKTIFVTVGTTTFDKLIETVVSKSFQECAQESGYTRITGQVGQFSGQISVVDGIEVVTYDYKPSIIDDITSSDLIISHAGL